jgi:tetratricopeptide (TPR) repeat protein
MRMRSLGIVALCASVFLLTPSVAYAGNEAAAEALFAEGQKLVKEKKYAEACAKFAESNRLDRGAGTLIHLADCYEKNKQTASAWATWKEAASAAQAINRADWQKLASDRSSKLEPKLAKLTIKVPESVDKLEVTKDGAPFAQATWNTPLPVDVGPHTIEATAPGHKPYKTTANVSKDGEKLDVVIPKLEALPADPALATKTEPTKPEPAKPAPKEEEDGSGQRAIGYIVAGVGVVGLAVGGVTGLMAMSANNEAKDKCPQEGACANKDGVDANESAKSLGLVSTIGFGAGAALIIGGAVLIFTAPKGSGKEARAVKVLPTATASGGGIVLGGSF